jgi:N-acetylglucosamine-6-phosphate deacetylase
MSTTLLHVRKAITPKGEIADAGILVRDGEIESIGPRAALALPSGAHEVRAQDTTAIPGFIDVHIHGAGGRDVMEGNSDALATVAAKLAQFGTTSLLATTVTADAEDTVRAVEGISGYIATQHETNQPRAEILGIHFEGPFLSKERRGVHRSEFLQLPSSDYLQRLLRAAAGNARILTIAPELLGAMPCIDAARSLGMVVSIGHTDATYEQARAAVAHGAHHATHVYNAMRPFTHRDPGVIGAVLTTPEITAELIADGIHVDDVAMKVLLQAKGPDGVVLISDGLSATGMPDGQYMLGGMEVTVSGGVCRSTAEGHARPRAPQRRETRRALLGRGADAHAEPGQSFGNRIQERRAAHRSRRRHCPARREPSNHASLGTRPGGPLSLESKQRGAVERAAAQTSARPIVPTMAPRIAAG